MLSKISVLTALSAVSAVKVSKCPFGFTSGPVADDDKKKPAKLSAVEWAKKAGEEKLVAYRDHMAAARAADRDARGLVVQGAHFPVVRASGVATGV